MKALIYEGNKQLTLKDIPEPEKNDEVLVRVAATGICGSDLHAFRGEDERRPAPLILGHETAGTALNGCYKGQPVVINPLVTCQTCHYCLQGKDNLCPTRQIISLPPREGAFAEMVVLPEINLIPIENNIDYRTACLAEPLATGYHGIVQVQQQHSRPIEEANILIIGGGAIGVGILEILLARGLAPQQITLVEKNPLRLNKNKKIFPNSVVDPDELAQRGGAFQVVFDAVGNTATHALSSFAAAPGSTIIRIGLEQSNKGYDIRRHSLQEITLLGSYTYTKYDFLKTTELIFSGKLGHFPWVSYLPLDEAVEAFNQLDEGSTPFAKIVLDI